MKIYTSNYWKYKGDNGVQISCGIPEWFKVKRRLALLFPSWESVKRWNSVKKLQDDDPVKLREWDRFQKEYWKKLSMMGPSHVLPYLSDGDVLLCWCHKTKWCHRAILAEWLRTVCGVEVEEI